MISVLIADDHPIVRQGLKQILAGESDVKIVGEAQNTQEIFKLIGTQPWDIVILDLSMPDRGGLEVLNDLHRDFPQLPILILSMHPEDQFAVRVLKAGASGYMTKDSAPEELVNAIRKILAGHKYISSALAEKLAKDLEAGTKKLPHETLSDREYHVMCMLASGKTVSEIAKELSLSVKTISTYRARVLEKMGMKNNAELIHYVLKNKLAY
ncbi:response regulator transcription factor [Candidatus Acetothermia bacterium]|nr:response regulator transcription factor [Candidatus Acetothermia bacterium]